MVTQCVQVMRCHNKQYIYIYMFRILSIRAKNMNWACYVIYNIVIIEVTFVYSRLINPD